MYVAVFCLYTVVMIVSGMCVDVIVLYLLWLCMWFFFQAEDGIRDLVRSRGLGDVYKRQAEGPRGGNLRAGILRQDDVDALGHRRVPEARRHGLSLIHI